MRLFDQLKLINVILCLARMHSICSAQQSAQKPQINSPEFFGVRTAKRFFYTVPVSGSRPMEIIVKNLPKGVSFDNKLGVISGRISKNGSYQIKIVATNKIGVVSKPFAIVVGDKLALTPPMGWSSWYSYGRKAKESDILKTAQLMKHYGLDQYGWSILEIDDPWTNQPDEKDSLWERLTHKVNNEVYQYHEGPANLPDRKGKLRASDGQLRPNQYFTNIEQTVKQIHDLGFKVGIYSSPGPLTCGGVAGSYGHELQDAQYFARVGFDYLKYDWCSYGVFAKDNSVEELMKPYTLMGNALKNQSRDIVFALCQYGMGDVWKWGYQTGGQLWRTGDDVRDNWSSVYAAFKKLADKSEFVHPGRWNDPDILQIGAVGAESREGNSNHLSKEEQHTVMTMWCLLSAPLFIGANFEHIDPFTLSLITNNEVIAIDQDASGKAANLKITLDNKVEVWTKRLNDGRIAVGLLNPNDTDQAFDFQFSLIGEDNIYRVRDLWQKKTLGKALKALPCNIPSHGILLITIKH